jgi:sigma-B regulation protein RsbU (phosphoserine phosphatase)
MSWLEIKSAGHKSYRVSIKAGAAIRVGRSNTNDVILSEDSAISRYHAEFAFDGEVCTVTDLGSRNGTIIEGESITGPKTVTAGIWTSVGRTRIRLVPDVEPVEKQQTVTLDQLEIAGGDSVMLSASEIVGSVQKDSESSAQQRAFSALIEATDELLAQRPLDEVLELIVNLVVKIASPDRSAVLLLEGEPPELREAVSRGVASAKGELTVSRTITDIVVTQKKSVMTSDARTDDRFDGAESVILRGIRSAMCVPLWNNKEVIGLIYVDMLHRQRCFSKMDLVALTLVANVAAVKIDNVRLFQQEQRMKEMERELRAAAKIQQGLLPSEPPEVAGYELFGHNKPCYEVGGDYFDYLLRDERTLSFAVGDVSGKGLTASLLMASIQAAFHAHLSTTVAVDEFVSQLNKAVCRASAADKFSTFFYGEIDLASGLLRFCNAGHNPPLLVRAAGGETELLSGGGMILGFEPDVPYRVHEASLNHGDLIVAYSDGVTESVNTADEEFGEDRLIEAVRDCGEMSVEAIRGRIDGAVDEFVGEADQFDDYTLLLLRRS